MEKKEYLKNSFIIGIVLSGIVFILMGTLNLILLRLICSTLIFSLSVVIGTCLEYQKDKN